MGASRYFAYFMILAGVLLEFFTFQICHKIECYFFIECGVQLSAECIAAFFLASLLLIVGGAYILKKQMAPRYT